MNQRDFLAQQTRAFNDRTMRIYYAIVFSLLAAFTCVLAATFGFAAAILSVSWLMTAALLIGALFQLGLALYCTFRALDEMFFIPSDSRRITGKRK